MLGDIELVILPGLVYSQSQFSIVVAYVKQCVITKAIRNTVHSISNPMQSAVSFSP